MQCLQDVIFLLNFCPHCWVQWNPTVCQRIGGVSSYIISSLKYTFVQTCKWCLIRAKAHDTFTCLGKQQKADELRSSNSPRSRDPPECGLSNFYSASIWRHCCCFSSFYSLSQILSNTGILQITLQDHWLCLSWEASSAWTTNTRTIISPR